ncbi:PilZ domain-containing protein [Geodermatophilus saharensis]|uniref:PilZ domain-containing protein n=1 Tax=Geodermatophilus saharensis TaxID=1137994 RepID=A0A239GUH5_9ACTN|nr:PilZ domain-containing protein [Geodermatophilus saharensis]SNS72876.1 PilZ domain-containing protein [Geodermatophilus saharensis]
MTTPGVDHPEEKAVLDVKASSRADVLTSFVERVSGSELVVSVGEDAQKRRVRLDTGEHLELIWRGPEELRSLPAELVEVVAGDSPTWRLKIVGPASRGQRRNAVRAPMSVPIELAVGERVLPGTTVDLSEGGTRCLLTGKPGAERPEIEVGAVHPVVVDLDGDRLAAKAEVIRRHPREDHHTELSLRFVGLGERREDAIRRRVFAELRDLRSRGLI